MKAIKLTLLSALLFIMGVTVSPLSEERRAGKLAEDVREVCTSSFLMNAPDQVTEKVLRGFCCAMKTSLETLEDIVRDIKHGELSNSRLVMLLKWLRMAKERVHKIIPSTNSALRAKKRGRSDLPTQFVVLGRLLSEYLHYLLAHSLLSGLFFNYQGDLEQGIGALITTILEREVLSEDIIKEISLSLDQWGNLPDLDNERDLMGDRVSEFYRNPVASKERVHPLIARLQKVHGRPRWIGLDGPEHRIFGVALSLFVHHCLSENYIPDIDYKVLQREEGEAFEAAFEVDSVVSQIKSGGRSRCHEAVGVGVGAEDAPMVVEKHSIIPAFAAAPIVDSGGAFSRHGGRILDFNPSLHRAPV